MTLAEIPYPLIDPVIVRFGETFALRWYGVSYIVAFVLAYVVLVRLSKRGRWPVDPSRVGDVLFFGILGVFLGGRVGYMLFYADDRSLGQWFRVWEGGMSFHGGLLGVVLAYVLYAKAKRTRFRDLADGLALATGPGIVAVRLANFVNGELYGRPFDGPWAMRFPVYDLKTAALLRWTEPRHPSQLYQALLEGLLLFLVLRHLMLKRNWGGGTVASAFLVGYGVFRFAVEYVREPDKHIGLLPGGLTEGQWFSLAMGVVGLVSLALTRRSKTPGPAAPPAP